MMDEIKLEKGTQKDHHDSNNRKKQNCQQQLCGAQNSEKKPKAHLKMCLHITKFLTSSNSRHYRKYDNKPQEFECNLLFLLLIDFLSNKMEESRENWRGFLDEFDANLEIFKIFSWLPAKSIFRFKLTCKACNEFPSDVLFVKQQYMHMGLKNESAFFIQPRWSPGGYHKLEFHVNPGEEASSGLPNESLKFLKSTTRVLASSNGLLCCRYKDRNELIICNPTTQSWKLIEVPMSLENFDLHFNIVFQCSIKEPSEFLNDFLLMMIKRPQEWSKNATCKVYLLQPTGNWEEIGQICLGPRRLYSQSAIYYYGNVHLLLNCFSPTIDQDSSFYWPHILAYDFKRGTQRFIQIPEDARGGLDDQNCQMCIFEWGEGETLCLVQLAEGHFTIWTLRDHSSSSWTRVMKICTQDIGILKSYDVAGFKVVNGEFLLVATKEKVYRYYLRGDFDRKPEEICEHLCGDRVSFHSYSSTLRPCGNGAMPIPK